jgi:hypothetical protein
MRRVACVVATVILLAASPGDALDAARTDIIGLHLGMPEAEIVDGLKRQGFSVVYENGRLFAKTRDGQLTIDLADNQGARQIRYVFTGRGMGEQEKIRASVIERFGAPDQAKPMTWCHAGHDGTCPADRASLMFLPESLTLVLRTGTQ